MCSHATTSSARTIPGSSGNPSRANPIAYDATSASSIVPKSRSSSIQASNAPGTHAASGPVPGIRSWPANASIVAAAGAGPCPQITCGAPSQSDQREIAARAVEVRLDDLERQPGRDRGVERVPAALEHGHPGRRRQPVRRGHHAEGAGELRTGREGHPPETLAWRAQWRS